MTLLSTTMAYLQVVHLPVSVKESCKLIMLMQNFLTLVTLLTRKSVLNTNILFLRSSSGSILLSTSSQVSILC